MQRWLISVQKLGCGPSATISRLPNRSTRAFSVRSLERFSIGFSSRAHGFVANTLLGKVIVA